VWAEEAKRLGFSDGSAIVLLLGLVMVWRRRHGRIVRNET
jgi:hypothetical protein